MVGGLFRARGQDGLCGRRGQRRRLDGRRLVDGRLVCSCLVLAASAVGQPIVTVEGLAEPGAPSDVQRAFVEAGAVQCGFCTPGLIIAAHDLLERNPDPTDIQIREDLSGNVCRCTGYGRILAAVQQVAVARRQAVTAP